MTPAPDLSHPLQGAILALRAQFFVAGALFATWGVHVPSIKAHYGLGERSLAFAMLAGGAGAVVALLYAGRVLARHAPRRVVPFMALGCVGAVGSLLVPSSYGLLLALMLAYGMAAALFDVAINDEATAIERHAGRPLMSGFHGMFSLGGMVGAATWSLLAAGGVTPFAHLVAASAALGGLALAASPFMLRAVRQRGAEPAPLSLPRGPLVLLGLHVVDAQHQAQADGQHPQRFHREVRHHPVVDVHREHRHGQGEQVDQQGRAQHVAVQRHLLGDRAPEPVAGALLDQFGRALVELELGPGRNGIAGVALLQQFARHPHFALARLRQQHQGLFTARGPAQQHAGFVVVQDQDDGEQRPVELGQALLEDAGGQAGPAGGAGKQGGRQALRAQRQPGRQGGAADRAAVQAGHLGQAVEQRIDPQVVVHG